MPYVSATDDTQLFVTDWGSGPPVVFVHGGQLGGDMWEQQVPALLDAGCRCLTYDRRGCGRSDQPGSGYDYDTFADDLASVLDALDLREATLVGHSNGCGDIVRYLSRHGAGQVARIALVAPTTPFLLRTDDNPDGVPAEVFEAIVAAMQQDRPAYFAAYAPTFFGADFPGVSVSRELVDWGVRLALRSSPLATAAMTRTFPATDLRPDLRTVGVPTLVVHGKHDATAPFGLCGQATADLIPGARLEAYATGHGLFVTEAERLNRDLVAHVSPGGAWA
jgi:pimeloyl-ACP methyl ester carboxylesterase